VGKERYTRLEYGKIAHCCAERKDTETEGSSAVYRKKGCGRKEGKIAPTPRAEGKILDCMKR
jgi:hypothetical protein